MGLRPKELVNIHAMKAELGHSRELFNYYLSFLDNLMLSLRFVIPAGSSTRCSCRRRSPGSTASRHRASLPRTAVGPRPAFLPSSRTWFNSMSQLTITEGRPTCLQSVAKIDHGKYLDLNSPVQGHPLPVAAAHAEGHGLS